MNDEPRPPIWVKVIATSCVMLMAFGLASCAALEGTAEQIIPAETSAPPLPAAEHTMTPEPQAPELTFDGARAYQHVEAQTAFGPRPTGSEALVQTGQYIIDQLAEAGWSTQVQEFVYQDTTVRNLIASHETQSDRVIVIGAHYDTRRQADRDPRDSTAPVMGANDGASGVSVLIELANSLETEFVAYDVRLVFFDAEDNGGLDGWNWIVGSTYYVENLEESPEFAIIVDMIGDYDQTLYWERNSNQDLNQRIWDIAAGLGYRRWFIQEPKHSILDDHTPFLSAGIPAVDIIDFDYPYWHTADDTADKVSPDSLERIGRVLEAFLELGP